MPLTFHEQGVDDFILEHFGVEAPAPDLDALEGADRALRRAPTRTVRIALVGKYVQLEDAYLSVSEALRHAASLQDSRVEIDWIDSEQLLEPAGARRARAAARSADGILIPGGFGGRGIEGKIAAAQVAREQAIPYLGICLGMHVAVAEFARNVAGMEGANSTELDLETPYPVIDLLPEQKEVADLGGTMRLGADPIKLHDGTRAREIYGEAVIYERHRHRYEVNNLLRKRLRERRACGIVGHLARRAPGRGDRARRSTRSSSPRSSTPSSSRAPSARRRCSASFVAAALDARPRAARATRERRRARATEGIRAGRRRSRRSRARAGVP